MNGTTAELEDATELFTRYSAGVYRYCLRRLGSREEAEDALQLTYLNAWRSLKQGFEPDRSRPWLFQIAANVCASVLRSKLGGTRVELRDPGALDELAAAEGPASEELLGLSEALRELPSRQRRALVMRDWQGLSYDEIAAEMAVSDSAVETLLFRARRRVATALADADWRRRVAPSARALLIWPFAFVRAKSAATAGAEHLKLGLVLAGGTVAPLVAFGVIQSLVSGPQETTQPTRAPALMQLQDRPSSGLRLQERSTIHVSMPRADQRKTHGRTHDEPGRQGGHESGRQGGRQKESRAQSTARPPSKAASNPGRSHESKIVLCHATHSKKRPGVTIEVSEHALKGHRQDSPGACR